MKPAAPLSQFPLFSSNSVEEAEFKLSRSLAGCRIKRIGDKRRFSVEMDGVTVGKTSLVHNRYGTDSRIESALPGEPVFFVLGSGRPSTFRLGDGSEGSPSARPMLIANARRMEIERPGGSGVLTLRVALGDIEHHLESITGRHFRGRLVFDRSADQSSTPSGFLRRLIHFFVNELDANPAAMERPIFRKGFEEMLLNGLLELPHNRSAALSEGDGSRVAPAVVRRAEEYLRANIGGPVTVADLVRVCGCSRSAIFAAFRRARGMAPLEFLTEQRLLAAQRALTKPEGAASVSSVAVDCGFVHLGRFAQRYRKRFGECPSETLKGGRARRP